MSELKKVITKTDGKRSFSSSVAPINLVPLDFRERLDEMAQKLSDKIAFIFNMNNGYEMTYSDLRDRSYRLAQNLMSLGLKRGERVGLLFPNTYELVICYYGCILAGLVSVPLNIAFCVEQIEYMMDNTEMHAFVFWNAPDYARLVSEVLPDLKAATNRDHFKSARFPHLRQVVACKSNEKEIEVFPVCYSFHELESKRIDDKIHSFPDLDPHDIFAILSTVTLNFCHFYLIQRR